MESSFWSKLICPLLIKPEPSPEPSDLQSCGVPGWDSLIILISSRTPLGLPTVGGFGGTRSREMIDEQISRPDCPPGGRSRK